MSTLAKMQRWNIEYVKNDHTMQNNMQERVDTGNWKSI